MVGKRSVNKHQLARAHHTIFTDPDRWTHTLELSRLWKAGKRGLAEKRRNP